MGIVKKQSFVNSVISYTGILLGFVNVVLLFPHILGLELYGLITVLIAVSTISAQFSQLGVVNIILRYFPHFKNINKKHNGFLFFVTALVLLGFTLVSIILLIFKSDIVSANSEKSALFTNYYYYLFLLIVFTVLFNVFDTYLRSLLKSILQVFLRDVLVRLLIMALLIIYNYQLIDFDSFLLLYILIYGSILLILLSYIIWIKRFFIKPDFSFFDKKTIKEIVRYGLFALLQGGALSLVSKIDIIMIFRLKEFSDVGIYAVAFYIGSLITVPARSIGNIITPLISDAWKRNDLKAIDDIYHKTSLNQLIICSLIFIGIWASVDSALKFLPPEFESAKYVIFFIGLSKLIDIAAGANSAIIINSKFYRFDIIANTLLVFLVIITNYIFIPIYGINGAAFATALSIFIINSTRFVFLKIKLNMQPFTWKTFGALSIVIFVYFISIQIPVSDHYILDIIIRSVFITVIYFPLIYFFKISIDINETVIKVWKRFNPGIKIGNKVIKEKR